MKLVITDSGLGGLSILGHLLNKFSLTKKISDKSKLEIFYVNASPSQSYGYNDMSSRKEKIETFNNFLESVINRFNPNYIYVACNTLSIYINELKIKKIKRGNIEGINILNLEILKNILKNNKNSTIFLFATPTTVNEKIYNFENILAENLNNNKIINKSCPGLASSISSDYKNINSKKKIFLFCKEALSKIESIQRNKNIKPLIFLGCTHFSFKSELFKDAFTSLGYKNVKLIDTNPIAANKIYKLITKNKLIKNINVKFISQYDIPLEEKKGMNTFLLNFSSKTYSAFNSPLILKKI